MKTKEERSSTFESHAGYPRILAALVFAVALLMMTDNGSAFNVYSDRDWSIQWDNTLKYNVSFRLSDQDNDLIDDPNSDDGNRNFNSGVVSNQGDILSELDIKYRNSGIRASAAGWYDTVYHDDNDNDSPGTFNGLGDHDEFANETKRLLGENIELLDAFFFTRGTVGDFPVSFRAGRHTLLWGETLFFAGNGIAFAQAPQDAIKLLSVPGTQAKELFMPVGQFSGQVQMNPNISLAGFLQFEWRRTRLPASGSYFSDADIIDAGGDKLFPPGVPLPPGWGFFRGDDIGAGGSTSEFGESNWDQWGISADLYVPKLDTDFGLYYVHYNDKTPQLYLDPSEVDLARGKVGEYFLVFPKDIHMLGASFGTQFGAFNVSGEVSWRIDTPLVSTPQVILPGMEADNDDNPLYAVGDTFHANLSTSLIMKAGRWWDGGTLLAEVGYNYLLDTTDNEDALDSSRDRYALGLRMVFEPVYYQVFPGWDFSVPVGLGYNPAGKSAVDPKFNGGGDEGGDVSVGLSAVYLDVWRGGIKYTNYFGGPTYNTLKDRDFISLTLERTF